MQNNAWQLEGRKFFLHSFRLFSLRRVLIPIGSKANVLIDKNDHARLTDFGLASINREENSTLSPQDRGAAGTTTWAAPEILEGGAVSKEGDVFTFAMVTVEVCTRGVFDELF